MGLKKLTFGKHFKELLVNLFNKIEFLNVYVNETVVKLLNFYYWLQIDIFIANLIFSAHDFNFDNWYIFY